MSVAEVATWLMLPIRVVRCTLNPCGWARHACDWLPLRGFLRGGLSWLRFASTGVHGGYKHARQRGKNRIREEDEERKKQRTSKINSSSSSMGLRIGLKRPPLVPLVSEQVLF